MSLQNELPAGATVAPVILASDKTRLSQFRGDQSAWPVYLSIGNLAKAVRRKVSSRATILVGYIPVSKLSCFTDRDPEIRKLAGQRLFHHCMSNILEPLIEAGTNGVPMVCADGNIRRVFPIVAAYVADHPEQCLITGTKENYCPRGKTVPNERGEPTECFLRDVGDTLDTLDLHQEGLTPALFEKEGLRAVYEPFWRNLPHCDIFACITPDILHQLHKGVFKDHLVSWCMDLVGDDEMDRRFRAVPDAPGLRYFRNGISHVSQWTGGEHKEMQKVFVGILAGAVEPKVLAVAQAAIDFIYLSQFQTHTTTTLEGLCRALRTFHDNKDVFVEAGIREHFNIPKIHSMLHYYQSILSKGTLDGYNTELPERLHIEYAKDAYRAGNRKEYITHMTTWLRRQEAVDLRCAYLEWLAEKQKGLPRDSDEGDLDADVADLTLGEGRDLDGGEGEDQDDLEEVKRRGMFAAGPRSYKIAKRCAFSRTTYADLEQCYAASQLLPAFQEYVKTHLPESPFLPHAIRSFRLFKQVKIERPQSKFVKQGAVFDRIRAVPEVPSRGYRRRSPPHFDTVLAIEDPVLYKNRPKGSLQGTLPLRSCTVVKLTTVTYINYRSTCRTREGDIRVTARIRTIFVSTGICRMVHASYTPGSAHGNVSNFAVDALPSTERVDYRRGPHLWALPFDCKMRTGNRSRMDL